MLDAASGAEHDAGIDRVQEAFFFVGLGREYEEPKREQAVCCGDVEEPLEGETLRRRRGEDHVGDEAFRICEYGENPDDVEVEREVEEVEVPWS